MCYRVLLPILVSGLDVNSPDELLEDSMQVIVSSLYVIITRGGSIFTHLFMNVLIYSNGSNKKECS